MSQHQYKHQHEDVLKKKKHSMRSAMIPPKPYISIVNNRLNSLSMIAIKVTFLTIGTTLTLQFVAAAV